MDQSGQRSSWPSWQRTLALLSSNGQVQAEGVNVRLSGKLQEFVCLKSDPEKGGFSSSSEYIPDLIRHDYEHEQARKWGALRQELAPGMAADESEFVPLDAAAILAGARQRRGG